MAAPIVLSTAPSANAQDVVLGSKIEIVFDQALDPASVSSKTVSVTGPGQTSLIDADDLIVKNPTALTGREYIEGTLSLANDNKTIVFVPAKPFRPSVGYQVTVAGGATVLALNAVKNADGEKLATSFIFAFRTGFIETAVTPPGAPLGWSQTQAPWDKPVLDAKQIIVRPGNPLGVDPRTVLEFEFPGEIDVTSFDPRDLLVGIEPVFGNQMVSLPPGLQSSVAVSGNKMYISITGWEED
jgi:hypothetical protein